MKLPPFFHFFFAVCYSLSAQVLLTSAPSTVSPATSSSLPQPMMISLKELLEAVDNPPATREETELLENESIGQDAQNTYSSKENVLSGSFSNEEPTKEIKENF